MNLLTAQIHRARAWLVMLALLAGSSHAFAVDVGEPAPDFNLAALDASKSFHLAEFKGKVILVDFWASWCGPCRQSLPLYEKLRAEFDRSDFDILAINLDEEAADAMEFIVKHPVTYATLQNPQGGVAKLFGVFGMPSSYLVDRDGIIRARHNGFDPKDIVALREQIKTLTAGAPHAN